MTHLGINVFYYNHTLWLKSIKLHYPQHERRAMPYCFTPLSLFRKEIFFDCFWYRMYRHVCAIIGFPLGCLHYPSMSRNNVLPYTCEKDVTAGSIDFKPLDPEVIPTLENYYLIDSRVKAFHFDDVTVYILFIQQ